MPSYPASWQHEADLSAKNTLAAPCTAAFYIEANSETELVEHVQAAKLLKLPVFILSGGSNVLCPERLDGLVIAPRMRGVEANEVDDKHVLVTVAAGENWHQFVEYCLNQGWFGLENLALIPGLCGAAPIQNIGAYGVELCDVLISVRFYNIEQGCFVDFTNSECKFGYRDSVFKQALRGKAIITALTLKLSKIPKLVCDYGPLKALFSDNEATPLALFDAVCELRRAKLPDPTETPNAGSFFKNPVISEAQFLALKSSYPEVPSFPVASGYVKVPAAWLIDQAGLKGENIGELTVHRLQALVLTNPKHAALTAILDAAEIIAEKVRITFAIELEREPQIIEAVMLPNIAG